MPDGPVLVSGAVEIRRSDGSLILEDTRLALCRCGASRFKPLCDGTHSEVGFRDPAGIDTVGERPIEESRHAALEARVSADGPVIVQGPVEVHGASDGSRTTDRLALCRCGASSTKPLCDGSHVAVGFEAD